MKTVLTLVVVVAIALLVYSNRQYASKLAAARIEVQQEIKHSLYVETVGFNALLAAQRDSIKADSALKVAAAHAANARALKQKLAARVVPDTCADIVAEERAAGEEWMLAFESQYEATVALQAQVDTLKPALMQSLAANAALRAASNRLVQASKRTFWDALVPKPSLNATVGVDPFRPEAGIQKVVGIGLSWTP